MKTNSDFFKYSTLVFFVSTVLLFILYSKRDREYRLVTSTGLVYLANYNKGCDQYKWRSNDNIYSIQCTSDGSQYDYWSTYNYFGKLLGESFDTDQNGLSDKEFVYNKKGEKILEFWDITGDGFLDKMAINRNGKRTIYTDVNEDGFFDEHEIVEN